MIKRSMAGMLVQEFARYQEDAPLSPYQVRLNGKFFCSADTADLSDQVAEHFSKTDLVGLLDTILRSES